MKLRRVYSTPNVDSAQRVLQAARGAGLDNDALSLIARSDIEVEGVPDERKDAKTDFLPAAARGAATGGAAGLVAGLVAIAVPPIGLTVASAGVMAIRPWPTKDVTSMAVALLLCTSAASAPKRSVMLIAAAKRASASARPLACPTAHR